MDTEAAYKAQITAGLSNQAVNSLIDTLAKTMVELDTAKARIAELEKPAVRAKK